MKCKKCGYENNDNAKFCNECGAKIYKNKNINYIKYMKNIYTKVRIPKIKFSNISKKMKIGIIILFGIILIGCIGGDLYYDNYKYQTGYNLTEDEKVSNINQQMIKNNYEGAEILVDNYFCNTTKYNEYLHKVKLCERYKTTSLNDEQEFKKIEENTKYKKIYDDAQKEIDRANGINNLKDYEVMGLIDDYCAIPETFENYDNVLDKIILLRDRYYKFFNDIPNSVKARKIEIGISKKEVLASSWGKPKDINKTTTKYGTNEQWVYSLNRYLYFDGDKLTSIQE